MVCPIISPLKSGCPIKPRLHEHQVPNPDSNLDHNLHGRGGLSLDSNPVCLRVNATSLDQDLDQNARVNGAYYTLSLSMSQKVSTFRGSNVAAAIVFSSISFTSRSLVWVKYLKTCSFLSNFHRIIGYINLV